MIKILKPYWQKKGEKCRIFISSLITFLYLDIIFLSITYHLDSFRVNGLSKDTSSCCDILHQFIERTPFNFFTLEISHWIHEVESHAALAELFDKQFLLFRSVNIYNKNSIDIIFGYAYFEYKFLLWYNYFC